MSLSLSLPLLLLVIQLLGLAPVMRVSALEGALLESGRGGVVLFAGSVGAGAGEQVQHELGGPVATLLWHRR